MKTRTRQLYNNHKEWSSGWKYKEDAPHDLEWQKDRSKLFKEGGTSISNDFTDFKVSKDNSRKAL